jgi:type VI protein secretion system component VasK
MLESILIISGIVLMVIAVIECILLIRLNTIVNLRWAWYVIISLVLFFLIGYIGYFILFTTNSDIQMGMTLISFILFFGAIFVITILTISYQLIKALTIRSSEITETNKNLTKNTKELEAKHSELEKIQNMLREKNKELLKTLDDFYTLRIGLQKDLETGKMTEENTKIKARIDDLKTNQPV